VIDARLRDRVPGFPAFSGGRIRLTGRALAPNSGAQGPGRPLGIQVGQALGPGADFGPRPPFPGVKGFPSKGPFQGKARDPGAPKGPGPVGTPELGVVTQIRGGFAPQGELTREALAVLWPPKNFLSGPQVLAFGANFSEKANSGLYNWRSHIRRIGPEICSTGGIGPPVIRGATKWALFWCLGHKKRGQGKTLFLPVGGSVKGWAPVTPFETKPFGLPGINWSDNFSGGNFFFLGGGDTRGLVRGKKSHTGLDPPGRGKGI